MAVSPTASAVLRWALRRWEPGALGAEALGVVCALWLVAGLWGPGDPTGLDTMAHIVRTDFGLREIFGRGHLNGWAPGTGMGTEIFLFYGPGLTLLTGALRAASLGLLSTAGAVKALILLSFLALPLAAAYLARSYGLSRRAAAMAGILSLAVSSPYGPGIEGTFSVGLLVTQVAAPMALVCLGALVRVWLDARPADVVMLAVSFAAVLITHPISAVILGFLGATTVVLLLVDRTINERHGRAERRTARWQPTLPGFEVFDPPPPVRFRDGLVLSAVAGAVSAALIAFWLLPFLAHRDLQRTVTNWPSPTIGFRLDEILDGRILFRPGVALFIVGGMAVCLLLEPEHRGRLALVLAPLAYLFIAHEIERRYPLNAIALLPPNRGLGHAGLVSVLPLAVVLDRVARFSGRWLGAGAGLVGVGAAVAIAVWPMVPLRTFAKDDVARPAMAEAAAELRRRVPEHARFVTERQPYERDATNIVSPPFWLAMESGRNTLNAFAPETMTAPELTYVGDSMTSQEPETAADRMARAGVSHVVTTSEKGAAHLRRSSRFDEVWKAEPLTIFAVRPAPDRPEPSSQVSTDGPARAELVSYAPEHLRLRLDTPTPVTATLAVARSPKWSARLDGRPIRLVPASDGLLTVRVPPGQHELRLDFRRDLWDRLGPAVTATTIAGGGWVLLRRRRTDATRGGVWFGRSA